MEQFDRFERIVREDESLAPFLKDIAAGASGGAKTETRSLGPDAFISIDAALFGVAVCALWSVVRIGIDHLRGLSEDRRVARQTEIVADLVSQGFSAKEATAVVTALLNGIQKRSADDPILKACLSVYQKAVGQ